MLQITIYVEFIILLVLLATRNDCFPLYFVLIGHMIALAYNIIAEKLDYITQVVSYINREFEQNSPEKSPPEEIK